MIDEKAPVEAEFAPIAVPSIAPPSISTVLDAVVDKAVVSQALFAPFLNFNKLFEVSTQSS